MRLLQAKVRCLKDVADSGWFKPGRKMTLLSGSRKESISQILKGLEALNPLYETDLIKPFADHPDTWQQASYRRKVFPEKKTAVTAVFSSNPELVKTLALLDDSLFETDRIELGRRLDYSRWVSFIELSASARWSDISDKVLILKSVVDNCTSSADEINDEFMRSCKHSDRIKGLLAQQCQEWLEHYSPKWTGKYYSMFRECLYTINLHKRFKLANRFVEENLPPIIRLRPGHLLKNKYTFEQLAHGNLSENDPVTLLLKLIFDRYSLARPTTSIRERLQRRVHEVSSKEMFKMSRTTFTIEEELFLPGFSHTEVDTPLAKRLMYIKLVCFLSEILWSRYPFLLLDEYDKELADTERRQMAVFLTAIAEATQVLLHPNQAEWFSDFTDAKKVHISAG